MCIALAANRRQVATMRFSALMFAARVRLRMDARTVLAELHELLLMSALLLCQAGDDRFCGGRSASANADRQQTLPHAIVLFCYCYSAVLYVLAFVQCLHLLCHRLAMFCKIAV